MTIAFEIVKLLWSVISGFFAKDGWKTAASNWQNILKAGAIVLVVVGLFLWLNPFDDGERKAARVNPGDGMPAGNQCQRFSRACQ